MIINISNNILVLQLQYNFSKLSDLIAAKVIYSHSVVVTSHRLDRYFKINLTKETL